MVHWCQEVRTINERFKQLRKALNLSQDEFAARIGLTRGAITNIEVRGLTPKPLLIDMVCHTYNVNKDWLTTGEGEMFVRLSRAEQIASFTGSVLASDENDFRFRFIDAITQLSPQGWQGLEELVNNITAEKEKTPDG